MSKHISIQNATRTAGDKMTLAVEVAWIGFPSSDSLNLVSEEQEQELSIPPVLLYAVPALRMPR